MLIRPATSADRDHIVAIHVAESRRAYADILPANYLADVIPREKADLWQSRLGRDVDPEALSVTVAEVDGEIAGFVSFVFEAKNPLGTYLHNLYVAARYQRRGIARQLLAHGIERLSAAQQHATVYLQVFSDNRPARAVYDKLGGRLIEEYARGDGPPVMLCRYQWPSAAALRDAAVDQPRRNP